MAENVVVLDEANFENEVLKSDIPVLVDFWATWCGPCKAIAPVVEEIAGEYQGKAKVCKVDVDANGPLAAKMQIMSIPTLVFFKGGSEVDKIIGAVAKDALTKKLDEIV